MKYSRLFRSALLLSVFVLMVGGFGSPVFAKKILLLSDTNSVGVNALLDDFIANGDEVTVVFSPDSNWTGANPSPEGFHSIVHLNGITWNSALSSPAQTALVEFVNNGGGYVGTQWIGYELYYGLDLSIMNDLVLHDYWPIWSGSVVYSTAPGQESHPILSGVPDSFTFESDGGCETQRYFAENPSTVLMTAHNGPYQAVLVREVGQGRVASFGFAPDYWANNAMQNPNIRKLILNAAIWTGGDGAEVTVTTEKAKVCLHHDDLHVEGRLYLPEGVWMDDLSPVGSVLITLADVEVTDQSVDFEIKGKKDGKWEYKDKKNLNGYIKEFKIDWKEAKFDYKGDDGFHIHTHFIGASVTTLCIHTGDVSGAFTVTIDETTTIDYDEERNIIADVGYDPQKGDNTHVHFTLPFQLTSETTIEISGTGELDVADYLKEGVAKFKLVSAFDSSLLPGDSASSPEELEIEISFGEDPNTISGSDLIEAWTKKDDKHWEYK